MSNAVIDLTNDDSDGDVVRNPKSPKTNELSSQPSPRSGHSRNQPIDLTDDDPVPGSQPFSPKTTEIRAIAIPNDEIGQWEKSHSRSRSRPSVEASCDSHSGAVEEPPQVETTTSPSSDLARRELQYKAITDVWSRQKDELRDDHARNVQVGSHISPKSSRIFRAFFSAKRILEHEKCSKFPSSCNRF